MKVGLYDVDGHNFPNLALMKLSAYHKARGDTVEWCVPLDHYDVVYKSRVFDDTYSEDIKYCIQAEKVIEGGTGYDLKSKLSHNVEHCYPDYGLYGETDTAYGFLTRGCPRGCPFCIVSQKEGRKSVHVADIAEFHSTETKIKLLDPNLLACKEHEKLLKQLADTKATVDFTQGIDIRLTNEDNVKLLNKVKVGTLNFAWDNPKEDLVDMFIKFNKLTNIPDARHKKVYVLTNFNTTHEEDRWRMEILRGIGFDPYIMIYDKPNAPRETRLLQRYCNNKIIFNAVENFEDYKPEMG